MAAPAEASGSKAPPNVWLEAWQARALFIFVF